MVAASTSPNTGYETGAKVYCLEVAETPQTGVNGCGQYESEYEIRDRSQSKQPVVVLIGVNSTCPNTRYETGAKERWPAPLITGLGVRVLIRDTRPPPRRTLARGGLNTRKRHYKTQYEVLATEC